MIGVDGGGSGCRARLFGAAGVPIGECRAGPANLLLGRPACEAVLEACVGSLRAAGLPQAALRRCRVGLAVAGATPRGRAAILAFEPPFRSVTVMSDAVGAALGAHDGQDGGVAILGTGAVACAWLGGGARIIGGHGAAVDDLGSGADLGRSVGRVALRAADLHAAGGPAPTGVAAALLDRHGGVDGLADWFAAARPADIASLAPSVFEAAESATEALLEGAARELERLLDLLAQIGAPRLSVGGSVGVRLVTRLPDHWQARLKPPLGDAADGAALAVRRGLFAR